MHAGSRALSRATSRTSRLSHASASTAAGPSNQALAAAAAAAAAAAVAGSPGHNNELSGSLMSGSNALLSRFYHTPVGSQYVVSTSSSDSDEHASWMDEHESSPWGGIADSGSGSSGDEGSASASLAPRGAGGAELGASGGPPPPGPPSAPGRLGAPHGAGLALAAAEVGHAALAAAAAGGGTARNPSRTLGQRALLRSRSHGSTPRGSGSAAKSGGNDAVRARSGRVCSSLGGLAGV